MMAAAIAGLNTIDSWVGRLERVLLGTSLIFMTVLIFSNVLLRFVTGETITFAEDLSVFLMICMSFFAASYAAGRAQHISMSAVYDLLPAAARKLLYLLHLVVGAGLALLLFVLSLQVTTRIYDLRNEIASMALPKFWPYLLVSLSLLFMSVHFVRLTVLFLRNRESDPALDD